jgi:hypothetical protein
MRGHITTADMEMILRAQRAGRNVDRLYASLAKARGRSIAQVMAELQKVTDADFKDHIPDFLLKKTEIPT